MAVTHQILARASGAMALAPRSLARYVTVYAQHIKDDPWVLPDGSTTNLVLVRSPVPASLANSDDYEEASVTNTSSTLVIDARFFLAENPFQDWVVGGLARVVCRVGARGDGTYATYIDRIITDIETVDSAGTYTTLASKDRSLSTALSNSSTSWETWDWLALMSLDRQTISMDDQIVLRIRIYAYMASGGTDQAVRLYHTRGSQDTYVDIPLDEI